MPRRLASASRCVPKAPDWVTMPSGPGRCRPLLEIGAEGRGVAGAQVEEAEAIGAAEPHAASPGDLGQALLHRRTLGAGLGKAGGEHDDGAHAFGDRGLHCRGRQRRRHRDQRELDRARHRGEVGIGP